MSMFAKDRMMARDGYLTDFAPVPKLEDGLEMAIGTQFILHGCVKVTDEWKTELGLTPMWHVAVSTLDKPDDVKIVSALGGTLNDKFSEKAPGDLPAIVESRVTRSKIQGHNNAYVINFIDEYKPKSGKRMEIEMEAPVPAS